MINPNAAVRSLLLVPSLFVRCNLRNKMHRETQHIRRFDEQQCDMEEGVINNTNTYRCLKYFSNFSSVVVWSVG